MISSDGTIGAVYISQIQGSAIDSGGILAAGKINSGDGSWVGISRGD